MLREYRSRLLRVKRRATPVAIVPHLLLQERSTVHGPASPAALTTGFFAQQWRSGPNSEHMPGPHP